MLSKEEAAAVLQRGLYDARKAELQAQTRGNTLHALELRERVRGLQKALRMFSPYNRPARHRGSVYCALRARQFIKRASWYGAPVTLSCPEPGEPLEITAGNEQLELQDWSENFYYVELPDLLDEIGPLLENRKG